MTAVSEGWARISVRTDEGAFVDSKMIHCLYPSTELNWALGQEAVGTGTADGNNVVANLVDDNTETRWSVEEFPKMATIDLFGDIMITQTEVTCYQDRAYQFIIEASPNQAGPYTTIVDRRDNKLQGTLETPIINAVDSVQARFVRITVFGANVYTGPWVSLTEVRVFGEGDRLSNVNELPDEDVVLFPNPATNVVTIEADDYDTVSVFDQAGRRVIQRKINKLITLDITELQSGVYIITLESDDKRHVTQLIKP